MLYELTKMAAYKSVFLDNIGTNFKRLYQCFRVRLANKINKNVVRPKPKWEYKMASFKPEVPKYLLVDEIETKFQQLYRMFRGGHFGV